MAADDAQLTSQYPCVAELLTLALLDGKERETATLTIFAEAGMFKAAFSDRETGSVLFRSAPTFAGLLEALEACLDAGTADWRPKARPSAKRP